MTPRGRRDTIDGWGEDAAGRPLLRARVCAAPTDGEANAALVKLLAKALGVSKSNVTLAAGAAARIKTVQVEGLDEAELHRRLGATVLGA